MKKFGYSAKVLMLMIVDAIVSPCALLFSSFCTLLVLDEPNISKLMLHFLTVSPILAVFVVGIAAALGVYRIAWKYMGLSDVARLSLSMTISFLLCATFDLALFEEQQKLKFLCYVLGGLLALFALLFSRAAVHYIRRRRGDSAKQKQYAGNIMIVGAGNAGAMLAHSVKADAAWSNCRVVCFIDDDPAKKNTLIYGSPVVGGRDMIATAADKYGVRMIILAMPSEKKSVKSELLELCFATGCNVKTLPDMQEILEGQANVISLREVKIEDLLGRDPIKIDLERVMGYVSNKTVLVTGGGGSIGSELCRQIASHNPRQLIIFDIYENNAYDILNELKRKCPMLNVTALIGSVRDKDRLEEVFAKYKPNIVYHAAAHKHVPLMEDSPNESVKNNVFGTYNTAEAADRHGVERFVLISTDKAVNPTNIMGASKRMCEMVIQTWNRRSKTEYVAVRFGNVLGSNGSVIPLFRRQIAEGGPVTVTHPDIIRYFMTIPEAVSLVLQAGASAKGGEIFVLDMGKPIKILTLAENMIRLSGLEVGRDIEIKFTGLRPGEKLYEELLMAEEGLTSTENDLIHIGKPIDFDEEVFLKQLDELRSVMAHESCDIRRYVRGIVTTYHPAK